ncbi:MAG: 6-phosphofructokinase [Lachnospiraceae bacterium]
MRSEITFQKGQNTSAAKKQVVGVILSGGQAPGGHNVVCGLYDALEGYQQGERSLRLQGRLQRTDRRRLRRCSMTNTSTSTEIPADSISSVPAEPKLETEEQFAIAAEVCKKHGITAIVIIGGDDSNTNAAVLAEYLAAHNTGVQVIGCPKTIDGDLKNDDIECSFGFDTATKTYSELIGNIERDCNSAKKYWHFIKVMGRSASHVALECALEASRTSA